MRVERSALVDRPNSEVRQDIVRELDALNAQLDKPLGPGWGYHWSLPFARRRRLEADLKIADWRPPEHVALRVENSFLGGSFTCSVQPHGAQTRIGGELELHLRGGWRLAEPIASRLMRHSLEEWADYTIGDAKARLEGRPSDPPPWRHVHPPALSDSEAEQLRRETREFRARGPRRPLSLLAFALIGAACMLLTQVLAHRCGARGCIGLGTLVVLVGLAALGVAAVRLADYLVLRPHLLVDEHGISQITGRGTHLIAWQSILSLSPLDKQLRIRLWQEDDEWRQLRGMLHRGRQLDVAYVDLDWAGLSPQAAADWICCKALAHGVDVYDGKRWLTGSRGRVTLAGW